jgi:hypothetical protein
MYLNEALTKLKNLKSKAARVDGYVNSSAVYYEDSAPEYVYADEVATRALLNEEIVALKTKIQMTNALTTVTYKGNVITLAELILRNGALRADMAFYSAQMKHEVNAASYRGRTKEDIKQILAPGCNKAEFRKKLEQLEIEKEEIERVMAHANASTYVV